MNHVYLAGRAGQDAVGGVGKSGSPWASCSVSTSRKVKDQVVLTWHRVVAFGYSAEYLIDIRKGDTVMIHGSLNENKYTNKEGKELTQMQVIAHTILRAASDEESGEPPEYPEQQLGF